MRDFFHGRIISVAIVLAFLVGCTPRSEDGEGVAPANSSSQVFRWKMITTWPKNLPGLGVGPERLADHLRVMSNGRLDIKVYGAGELVGGMEVFDAVSQGTAEMGHGAAYYWRGKIPAAQMFATVPFGMTAQEMNGWLHYGGGLELWRELYKPFDIVPFTTGNSGVQMGGWFNKEILSVDDLQGLKMRIPGLGGEVLARAGGSPQQLPLAEVYTALQTGVIDATELVGPYNDLAQSIYSVAKYYYYPGWHEPGSTLETLINKNAWESLSPDLQEMIAVATRAINEDMLSEFTAKNNAALNVLIEEHGVELRAFPEDVIYKLREISKGLVKESMQENDLSRRIYSSYMEFLESVENYHRISEQAFLEARAEATTN